MTSEMDDLNALDAKEGGGGQDAWLVFQERYAGKNAVQLGQAMYDLEEAVSKLELEAKKLNEEIKYLAENALPKRLEEEGLKNFRLENGKQVVMRPELQVSVAAPDRMVFLQWMRDHGHGSMIQEHIPPGTLKKWVKDDVLAQMKEPPPMVNVRSFKKAQLRS
jgi:hypothetical protein